MQQKLYRKKKNRRTTKKRRKTKKPGRYTQTIRNADIDIVKTN